MKKNISMILVFVLLFKCTCTSFVFAGNNNSTVKTIEQLVKSAEQQKEANGKVSEKTLKQLQQNLKALGVSTGSYGGTHVINNGGEISTRGYGETHKLGQGWTYRVDRPAGGVAKPHVHVDNKQLGIHAEENVDGTPSHKTTLDDQGVPKQIQKR